MPPEGHVLLPGCPWPQHGPPEAPGVQEGAEEGCRWADDCPPGLPPYLGALAHAGGQICDLCFRDRVFTAMPVRLPSAPKFLETAYFIGFQIKIHAGSLVGEYSCGVTFR